MNDTQPCPCCGTFAWKASAGQLTCPICSHRWRIAAPDIDQTHYRGLSGRNDIMASWYQRKTESRLAVLSQFMARRNVLRILEVGCAEGGLGRRLKGQHNVVYDGIELSRDAETAALSLDRVFTEPSTCIPPQEAYDLIVSFHVLEHVTDVAGEVAAWRRLLAPNGHLIIEVPNCAGHPLLDVDRNREHLHQFSPASLTQLLTVQGYEIQALTTGNYESPVYPDSLQVIATQRRSTSERRAALLARFRKSLGRNFIVYGIGGDFASYVEPLIEDLEIAALVDTATAKHGPHRAGHVVEAYDPARHGQGSILICSIRFAGEIRSSLLEQGVTEERMIGLDEVYGPSSSSH